MTVGSARPAGIPMRSDLDFACPLVTESAPMSENITHAAVFDDAATLLLNDEKTCAPFREVIRKFPAAGRLGALTRRGDDFSVNLPELEELRRVVREPNFYDANDALLRLTREGRKHRRSRISTTWAHWAAACSRCCIWEN